jgi:hypothetical protein
MADIVGQMMPGQAGVRHHHASTAASSSQKHIESVLHAFETIVGLCLGIGSVFAFLQMNGVYSMELKFWLSITVVPFFITSILCGSIWRFLCKHKIEGSSSRSRSVNKESADERPVPASSVVMLQSTFNRLAPVLPFLMVSTAWIVFVYMYADLSTNSMSAMAALEKGFNTAGIMTFVENRLFLYLNWVITSMAIYILVLLFNFYNVVEAHLELKRA